jgi:hypothetical protein
MRATAVTANGVRAVAGLLLAALVTTTMIGVSSPAAQAAPLGAEVGTVGDITWGIPRADIDRSVKAMADAGIRWVRANISWSGGEPTAKGQLNQGWLAEIDYAVTKATAAGMQVLMPIADGVPYWASADPARYQDASGPRWNKYWRPRSFTDYADFVRTVVNRYRPMGVHTYEVWNEPNHPYFWPSGPNAAEYASMLAATYPVVKQADPSATVLMGGLSKSDYNYLQALYAAGGRQHFDAVAVHPYAGNVDPTVCWNQAGTAKLAVDAFCAIEEVRRTMVANGDSAKAMWLTEFGWSTTTAAYGVSEATQAAYLTKAFTKLQSYPYVKAAFWYSFRNTYWLYDAPANFAANTGLLRTGFAPKPAYDAMKAWTGGPLTAPTTSPPTTAPPTTSPPTTAPPTTAPPTTAPPTTLPLVDRVAPVLTNLSSSSVTSTSGLIRWTTNEVSNSLVEYWVASPVLSAFDARLVTSHSVQLSGLIPRTTYSWRVRSVDAAGNVAVGPVRSMTTRK